ncbi:MAG: hypothetical protein AAGC55_23970 [Myxococcota bacterium]
MKHAIATTIALITAATATACGGSADFAGEYTISLTNGDNGCQFDDWVEGETSSNIPLTITQSDDALTAEIEGVAAVLLGLFLGTTTFTGEADGDRAELILLGERAFSEGNCSYTFNGVVDLELDGDFISGELRYEAATNDNPDCAALSGCASRQSFNGNRPPSAE